MGFNTMLAFRSLHQGNPDLIPMLRKRNEPGALRFETTSMSHTPALAKNEAGKVGFKIPHIDYLVTGNL